MFHWQMTGSIKFTLELVSLVKSFSIKFVDLEVELELLELF